AAAVEQVNTDLAFERADRGGQGLLRQVQPLGRAGDAALLGHPDEVFQLTQIHDHEWCPDARGVRRRRVARFTVSVAATAPPIPSTAVPNPRIGVVKANPSTIPAPANTRSRWPITPVVTS